MKILNGKKIAEEILDRLQDKIKKDGLNPGLAVVLVGNDQASQIYVNLKEKAAQKIGISFQKFEFAQEVSESLVLEKVGELNRDKNISGIIVQLPLPGHLNKNKIIESIDPKKDVDGFHPENTKLFFEDRERFFPVLPKAILEILKSANVNLNNADAAIITNSEEFGKVMEFALEKNGLSADYILKKELLQNVPHFMNKDIVISACGVPGLIKGDMVKKGSIIVDAGITRVGEKVVGDADFESVREKASYLTPVPNGVGPVTIACLLENVYLSAKKSL